MPRCRRLLAKARPSSDSQFLDRQLAILFRSSGTTPAPRSYLAWQTGTPAILPSLQPPRFVPAITLTGSIGDTVRVDCINAIGPIDAWVPLDTITLTNTSQLYFDVSTPWNPGRLYRIVPVP